MSIENRLSREWDLYEGGPSVPFDKRLHASLAPRGNIYINQTLYQRMGKPVAARLYYNRERDQIAIQPAIERQAISFPVRQHSSGGVQIHAAPFCTHFGIRVDSTQRFVEPEIDAAGTLILSLRLTVRVAGKRRKRKSSVR